MQYEMSTKEVAIRFIVILVIVFTLGLSIAWAIRSSGMVENNYNVSWLKPDGTLVVYQVEGNGDTILERLECGHLKMLPGMTVTVVKVEKPD